MNPDNRLTVMSYNIRYDTSDDGQNAWQNRRGIVIDSIKRHEPDLLGVQEALSHQFEYLKTELSDYSWYGVGRDDGQDTGEFVPIGYRTDQFSLSDNGTRWLSECPNDPGSKSWDAYCPRITSWVTLESQDQGPPITLFNTHFDHRSALARHRSAELLQRWVAQATQSTRVIVTADLNSPKSASPYSLLVGEPDAKTNVLQDSRSASQADQQGPERTYHEFTGIPFERRDYIFADQSFNLSSHRTIDEGGHDRFSSDHFPILADII